MPHRKLISALVAVLALNTLGAAAFAADPAVAFDPAKGDHRDYRVGMRMQFKADDIRSHAHLREEQCDFWDGQARVPTSWGKG